jgi:hypothetical protein
MALYFTPHSDDWFNALDAFNAMQAAHTRQILKLAGSDDVCSVCGDDPAKDYQLPGAGMPAKAVATLRLCDDFVGIRRAGGEAFVPFP